MRLLGFGLLLSGWFLVLSAIVLLRATVPQTAFVLAGVAVEAAGLILVFRTYRIERKEID
jgi:hypothetical protein